MPWRLTSLDDPLPPSTPLVLRSGRSPRLEARSMPMQSPTPIHPAWLETAAARPPHHEGRGWGQAFFRRRSPPEALHQCSAPPMPLQPSTPLRLRSGRSPRLEARTRLMPPTSRVGLLVPFPCAPSALRPGMTAEVLALLATSRSPSARHPRRRAAPGKGPRGKRCSLRRASEMPLRRRRAQPPSMNLRLRQRIRSLQEVVVAAFVRLLHMGGVELHVAAQLRAGLRLEGGKA